MNDALAEQRIPRIAYRSSRLHFKADLIEPLAMSDTFQVDTPQGVFQMTKAEFYSVFSNVVASPSYQVDRGYHYLKVPRKAMPFRIDQSDAESTAVVSSSNRQLTKDELAELFQPLLNDVRARLVSLAKDDADLHFALRRKLFKELTYDERSKPMQRRALKRKKISEQNGKCAICSQPLPVKGAILDRYEAMKGYVPDNVRVLCPACDTAEQEKKGYS